MSIDIYLPLLVIALGGTFLITHGYFRLKDWWFVRHSPIPSTFGAGCD